MKCAFALYVLVALAAVAGVPDWGDSPEAYFMTREERGAWERVQSNDEEAARFIAAFRAKHDRDFTAEVRRRAAIVDERMPLGEAKVSTTLRGKLVILLGAPAELKVKPISKAPASVAHPLEQRKGGSTDGAPRDNVIGAGAGWVEYTFRYPANPALGVEKEWSVVIEANQASGKDRLKYARDRKKLDDILDAAARTALRLD